MKNKLIYFKLGGLSFALLPVGMILFLYYILESRRDIIFILAMLCFLAFSVLWRVFRKKAELENGYTLFDAFFFKLRCNRLGYEGKGAGKRGRQLLLKAAQEMEMSSELSDYELEALYREGERVEKSINHPLLVAAIKWAKKRRDKDV